MGAHIADPEHCSDASSHCELVSPASWYIVRGGAISSCQDHATEIQYERSGEPTRVLNGTGLVAFPVFEMCPPYLIFVEQYLLTIHTVDNTIVKARSISCFIMYFPILSVCKSNVHRPTQSIDRWQYL